MTKVAWEKKQEEIQQATPGAIREQFVLSLPRAAYEQEYGKDYRKPGIFARIIGALYAILPKIGPFRPLAFKVPPPEAERLFLDSLTRTRARYRAALEALRAGRLNLPNVDFDTGKPSAPGEYGWRTRPCGSCRSASASARRDQVARAKSMKPRRGSVLTSRTRTRSPTSSPAAPRSSRPSTGVGTRRTHVPFGPAPVTTESNVLPI